MLVLIELEISLQLGFGPVGLLGHACMVALIALQAFLSLGDAAALFLSIFSYFLL